MLFRIPQFVAKGGKVKSDPPEVNKKVISQKLDFVYKATDKYSGICPEECSLCEQFEHLVLIPSEEEYILTKSQEYGIVLERSFRRCGPISCELGSSDCGMLGKKNKCLIYHQRPLDCRSFPVVPRFRLQRGDGIDFYLSNAYCPIADKLTNGYIDTMKEAWQLLSPHLPRWWKAFYNSQGTYKGMKKI